MISGDGESSVAMLRPPAQSHFRHRTRNRRLRRGGGDIDGYILSPIVGRWAGCLVLLGFPRPNALGPRHSNLNSAVLNGSCLLLRASCKHAATFRGISK